MKVIIDICPRLYDQMVEKLGTRKLGDVFDDPLSLICAHVRESVEHPILQKEIDLSDLNAINLIEKERIRQIEEEGFTAEHDAEQPGQMAQASASYAIMAARQIIYKKESEKPYLLDPLQHWPWDMEWWKPSDSTLRNLVKAGALIAAEIDRLLAEK